MPELGLSHLTVIRTHKNLDHLLSSVDSIIKLKRDVVNNFFRTAGVAQLVKLRSLGSNLRYCSSDTTTFCSRIEFFGSQLSSLRSQVNNLRYHARRPIYRTHKPATDAPPQTSTPARDNRTRRELQSRRASLSRAILIHRRGPASRPH